MNRLLPLLIFFFVAACGPGPRRFQVFELPRDKADVIWLRNPDGSLRRCWSQDNFPVCADAITLIGPDQAKPAPAPQVKSPAP